MNFELDEQHIQLQSAARTALERKLPTDKLRACIDPHDGLRALVHELWPWTAEMGWTGVGIPEAHGGLGLGLTEAMLLHEEFGRVLFVGPTSDTCVLAAQLLQDAPQELASSLRGIADGSVRAVHGRLSTEAATALWRDAHPRSSPAKDAAVCDMDTATHVLWTGYAKNGQAIAAWVPHAQHDMDPRRSADPTQSLASVCWRADAKDGFSIFSLDTERLVWAENATRLARCGELMGLAERALEETVAYVSQRHQFGKPVGSFQAVKHLLANAFMALENARTAVLYAAGALKDGLALDIAAVTCASMATRLTADCIQAHGGMGFTWESSMHLYFKRVQRLCILMGSAAEARLHIAEAVLDGPHPLPV